MSSESLHVPRDVLSSEARQLHHAIVSLKEELDAVDWYRQRADDTTDKPLREILLHNMREEMEHASMIIEWLRRNNKDFAGFLDTYLYTEAPIIEVERAAEGEETAAAAPATGTGGDDGRGFTVGSLREG